MPITVGSIVINGHFGLAPMAGITDAAFRRVCREHGAAYTVTEMISAKALTYHDEKTSRLAAIGADEHPSAVQIFGSEPGIMAEGAKIALALSGADIVDINMGCPTPKIVNNGEGCALLKNLPLASLIISAVASAVAAPVTVKFRTGWDNDHINAAEFARMAYNSGASALCIHGRTRTQQYAGKADRSLMAGVVAAVPIPVIVNGDIVNPGDGATLLADTGARFALIGRGCLGNPWLFDAAQSVLRGEAVPPVPPLSERLATLYYQTRLTAEYKSEFTACREARKHAAWYLKGVSHSSSLRTAAQQIETLDELKAWITACASIAGR